MKFEIGGYHNEVLCDIMPMDACHILLGMPWEFDNSAVHDGHANTYTLTKAGVRHKLKPLKEVEEKVCSSARICFIGGKEFLEAPKHDCMCKEVPVEVKGDLLNEFWDIVSKNVPKGLPSGRSNGVVDAFNRRKTLLIEM